MTFEMEIYYEWPSIVHLNSISYVAWVLHHLIVESIYLVKCEIGIGQI